MRVIGTVRTLRGGRAYVATATAPREFAVAPAVIAELLKAIVAQARVELVVEAETIVEIASVMLPTSAA